MSQGGNDGNLDPNLRLGDPRKGARYPSPFFDVSQQYIPPTIKELFKWVKFYCTNNSFLGPALNKIARYPITDLILEDESPKLVNFWTTLLNSTLQIKTFNMEANTDLTSYGNGFITIHYPFARLMGCPACGARHPFKSIKKLRIDQLVPKGLCPTCGYNGKLKTIDVPYKAIEQIRLMRISPEYIDIKYNDATGRHIYLYNIPDKLKRSIMSGDPDIFEDTPLLYLEAIKQRRKIKLNNDNLFHLKAPTLASHDMGWGMPRIANALKDLYYFYTLRRAQEAIMNEHIIPLDVIFPNANGTMDPYRHTDLGHWREEIKKQLAAHRRDPNYKAVMPFPIGVERVGGDGKALLLTPELDFLAKTIVGTMGIPQEFVYGGTMNWSGSSISLRTLENDFLHHRSQLLQMNIWLIERIRLYLGIAAPKTIRFTDFKMADDIQKLQILLQAAQMGKVPWDEYYKETGRDPEVIKKKLEEEAEFDAKIADIKTLKQAESQTKGEIVQQRMRNREQQPETPAGLDSVQGDQETLLQVAQWADQMQVMPPEAQEVALRRLQMVDRALAKLLEKELHNRATGLNTEAVESQIDQNQSSAGAAKKPAQQQKPSAAKPAEQKPKAPVVNMKPQPQQLPPRRQGGI